MKDKDVDSGFKWLLAIALTLLVLALGILGATIVYSLWQVGYLGALAGIGLIAIVLIIRRSL